MTNKDVAERTEKQTASSEWLTFLVFTLVILPGIAVAAIGSYGLAIWIYQMIYGPPIVG
ncbi:TorE protein [Rhodobacteraceae bacterium RKSG542]|uniref:periplasmic nitrate reductase, NapE protein n=1 Tax=Pseudovibrio flavus TaxID=2529854 RepID=UPI0012BD00F5|nr:periplasmic nitrate reductase, NapE protein [Pseudovibrio flavus]MTI16235.1 TorE protein [Pseudovibrio flavus]